MKDLIVLARKGTKLSYGSPGIGNTSHLAAALFDTEDNARVAEATFNTLRQMPDAPATFISVDVCEVIGRA